MSKIIKDHISRDPKFFDVVTYTDEGVARDLYNITPVQSVLPDDGRESERESIKAQIMGNEFTAQYQRIIECSGARTQVELGEYLGIRQSSISDARRRGSVPAGWLVALAESGFNPKWIMTGVGGKYLIESNDPNAIDDAALRDAYSKAREEAKSEILASTDLDTLVGLVVAQMPAGAVVTIHYEGKKG